MFFANCICTFLKQLISLVAVGCLQRCKDSDVTGLELVGSVKGEVTQDDVVFKTKLQDFEGLVCPKAVTY
jgi:hypothetical protein